MSNTQDERFYLEIIRSAISEVVEGGDWQHVTMETKISSLGLDSLAVSEIAASIEDRLGLILTDDRIARAITIRELVLSLVRHSNLQKEAE